MSRRRRQSHPRRHRRPRDPNAWRKPGLEPVTDRRREERKHARAKVRRRTVAWVVLLTVLVVGVGWALAGPRLTGSSTSTEAERAAAEQEILQTTNVVFPEGLRREDMAKIVEEQTDITAAGYLQATKEGPRGRRLAGTNTPTSLEGYLFPATYEVNVNTTAQDLVDRQIEAFESNTAGVDYSFARSKNLTPHEVLSIAAMVEREAQLPEERARVAGVIYNRLRNGMLLGIDATVQYAVGEWKPDLTVTDLDDDSPYNTRKFFGLPPGPIASPGIASILAAAEPEEHNFLYYVARGDGSGGHYFATSAEEFDRLVARAGSDG